MDLTLPVTGGGLVLVIGAFVGKEAVKVFREKMKQYDQHLVDCGKKAVDHALLESKVDRIDEKVCDLKTSMDSRMGRIDRMDEKLNTILVHVARQEGPGGEARHHV